MSFQLSPNAEKHNVFIACSSEISDRLDPEMVLFRRKTHQFRFPVRRLREFFCEKPQYGANERGTARETGDEPRYIRITDIDENGFLTNELGASAEVIESQYVLSENDLLLARSGNTVGKSYLHKAAHAPYPCFFAGYLIRFRFDTSRILPDYVFALTQLPYYKHWVKAIQRVSGQPNINADEYSKLEICDAPILVQKEVIIKLEKAYAQKRAKENEARSQLAQIDTLLLQELGITLPPAPPSTIQDRVFIRRSSQLTGQRFDPNFFRTHFQELLAAIEEKPHCKLGEVVYLSTEMWDQKSIFENEFPYVEIGEVDFDMGEIGKVATIPISEAASRARMLVEPNDLLISLTRPTRRAITFAPSHLEQSVASIGFAVIKNVDEKIASRFLFHVLRSTLCTAQFEQRCSGGSYPAITSQQLLQIAIPLPDIELQKRIVFKIGKQYEKAKQLFEQAKSELADAKAEIEQMILGGVAA